MVDRISDSTSSTQLIEYTVQTFDVRLHLPDSHYKVGVLLPTIDDTALSSAWKTWRSKVGGVSLEEAMEEWNESTGVHSTSKLLVVDVPKAGQDASVGVGTSRLFIHPNKPGSDYHVYRDQSWTDEYGEPEYRTRTGKSPSAKYGDLSGCGEPLDTGESHDAVAIFLPADDGRSKGKGIERRGRIRAPGSWSYRPINESLPTRFTVAQGGKTSTYEGHLAYEERDVSYGVKLKDEDGFMRVEGDPKSELTQVAFGVTRPGKLYRYVVTKRTPIPDAFEETLLEQEEKNIHDHGPHVGSAGVDGGNVREDTVGEKGSKMEALGMGPKETWRERMLSHPLYQRYVGTGGPAQEGGADTDSTKGLLSRMSSLDVGDDGASLSGLSLLRRPEEEGYEEV